MRGFLRIKQSGRLGTALLLALSLVPLLAMKPGLAQEGPAMSLSVPDDWTHHHLVFSGARSDAAAQRLQDEPRYLRQWLIHNRPRRMDGKAPESRDRSRLSEAEEQFRRPMAAETFTVPGMTAMYEAARARAGRRKPRPQQPGAVSRMKQDWAVALPATAEVGDNMFPAKFNFDVTAPPDCDNDFVAFNTGRTPAVAVAASQTGTFTASSVTGTVVVNGTTLTASPGTAATQTTTITTNNVNNGSTITITNGGSSATYTASAPVAEVDRILFVGGTFETGDTLTIAGIGYQFRGSNWFIGPSSGTCYIRTGTTANMVSWLASAISFAGSGGSTSTWQCNANAAQPAGGVTVTGQTSPNVDVTAKIPGSTAFVASYGSNANEMTVTETTAGTDGSNVSPNFQYWSGNARVSQATLAGNIRTAIGGAAAVGVGASGSSTTVTLTATASGLAGNSISVATTILSGLTGAAFNGNLSGGTAGTTAGTTFSTSTDSATASVNLANEAAALANRINANVSAVTATSAAGTVTVTAAVPGTAGNGIGTTETFASGFTWAGATLINGVDGAASILAYNRLYSTQSAALQGYCGGSGPSVMWAYTTGTGSVVTSPVLSLDGTKIIYVETKASGAVLHVLKWAAGEGTGQAPAAPAHVITDWSTCTSGSCLVNVALSGTTPAVTRSAPFYDYANDAVYVGDDNGVLHKITPVLSGTPAEVTTGGWPVTVHAGYVQNGPVLDSNTNRIFVTDSNGTASYVCHVPVAGGSATCAAPISGVISDPVLVDSSAGRLYAVSSESGASVHQYDANFAASAGPLMSAQISLDPNIYSGRRFYAGAFDHNYLVSADGSGKMYVCGTSSGSSRALLYRLTIAPTMSGSYDGYVSLTDGLSSGDGCSPVTEFYNASTGMDWIFVSVGGNPGAATGTTCATAGLGCLVSLNVTGTAWPPLVVTAGYVTPGNTIYPSTSGIIVDNAAGNTTVPTTTLSADVPLVNTTTTTLSAAVDTAQTCIRVASTAGLSPGDTIQVYGPGEEMTITAVNSGSCAGSGGTIVQVSRPSPVSHAITEEVMEIVSGTVGVASVTGFAAGDFIQVDAEVMRITSIAGTTLTVTRPRLGTTPADHLDGTAVVDLRTTLLNQVVGINSSTTSIPVDGNTTFNVDDFIQIDNEAMLITAKPTTTTLAVMRGQLGSTAVAHINDEIVFNLSKYPQAASIYFSFATNSSAGALCNGSSGVGCAVKLTQDGLR